MALQDFQRMVTGTHFSSARLAERRLFDWNRLSDDLGVAPDVLFEMSERSYFVRIDDTSRLSRQRIESFPWMDVEGYPVYNPVALQRSEHLRMSWSRPGAIVDPQSGTFFLRHCHDCRVNLSRVRWLFAQPLCPECGASLVAAPKIEAPEGIVSYAAAFSQKVDQQFRIRPINNFNPALTDCAAAWHVSNVLRMNRAYNGLALYLVDEVNLGPLASGTDDDPEDVGAAALRHAQLWIAADHACKKYPIVTRRFKMMVRYPRNLGAAPKAIEKGLSELVSHLKLT
jgi:hypothetical protein